AAFPVEVVRIIGTSFHPSTLFLNNFFNTLAIPTLLLAQNASCFRPVPTNSPQHLRAGAVSEVFFRKVKPV
ncbi:MAG: hypothetical protein WBA20_00140, partial [Ketobacter sp.]